MELARTIVEMQSTMDSLKDEQKLMESVFEEKENELRTMQEKGSNLGQGGGSEIFALTENLKQKEAEIEDLKRRLETPSVKTYPVSTDDFPKIVTANNGTTEGQNEETDNDSKGKDENSRESAKYGGEGDKHITNEDASKSKLTEFRDGEAIAEIKDEIRINEELGKKNEDPQDSATAKDIEAEEVEDREKKTIGEEQQGQLENTTDGGRQDSNVKQLAGVKRKHGRSSRTKGKRWRAIVRNRLREINGVFESHGEVNMGNRKDYRDEKDELNDGTARRDSGEENSTREDDGRGKSNPPKVKPKAKLLKPENHENREDGNKTTVDNTNHQVTNNNGSNIYPEKLRPDEIGQSEEHADGLVQQNWSRRHINKASKSAGSTESNRFHDEPEELEASDVQKQEKDAADGADYEEDNNDDFFKESHSEFEDEKEEYKEEIDESEFQPGL